MTFSLRAYLPLGRRGCQPGSRRVHAWRLASEKQQCVKKWDDACDMALPTVEHAADALWTGRSGHSPKAAHLKKQMFVAPLFPSPEPLGAVKQSFASQLAQCADEVRANRLHVRGHVWSCALCPRAGSGCARSTPQGPA